MGGGRREYTTHSHNGKMLSLTLDRDARKFSRSTMFVPTTIASAVVAAPKHTQITTQGRGRLGEEDEFG